MCSMVGKLGIVIKRSLCVYVACVYSVHSVAALDAATTQYVTHDVVRPTDIPGTLAGSGKVGSRLFYMTPSDGKPNVVTFMDTDVMTSFNYTVVCENHNTTYVLKAITHDSSVLRVHIPQDVFISCKNATDGGTVGNTEVASRHDTGNRTLVKNGDFRAKLSGGVIGTGIIDFILQEQNYKQNNVNLYNITERNPDVDVINNDSEIVITYKVLVLRRRRPVDFIFRVCVYSLQVMIMMGFGVKLDLAVVRDNLRRPVAPAIGLSCQYILMPLIAFTVAKLVTAGDFAMSLGIFVAGCCPGGGGSNMYSYLLNGDLTLSLTMTALSTVAALGMIPLWVYTLGSTFMHGQENINIPFLNVVMSLSFLILPLLFGLLLQRRLPKVANIISKVLRPVTLFTVVVLVTVGFYSNAYIFRLFKPRVVLAGCLLPYVGYILGGLVATVLRRDWKRIKTIALETGMQNTSIAYILLMTSLPPPIGDIAVVAPVAAALMTLIPPFFITIVYIIYGKCTKKDGSDSEEDNEKNGDVTTKLTNTDVNGTDMLDKTTVI